MLLHWPDGLHPISLVVAILFLVAVVLVIRRLVHQTRETTQARSHRSNLLNQMPGELRWRVYERDRFSCQRCGTGTDLIVAFRSATPEHPPLRLADLETRCVRCAAMQYESSGG
jgi:hypothetical protein